MAEEGQGQDELTLAFCDLTGASPEEVNYPSLTRLFSNTSASNTLF
jgi:hypothetical protein